MLVDAFANKCVALVKLHLIASAQSSSDIEDLKTNLLKDIQEIFTEAGKFIDLTDSKVKHIV